MMPSESNKCRIVDVEGLNPHSPVLLNFEHGYHSVNDDSNLKCSLFVDEGNVSNRTVIVSKGDQQFFGNVSSQDSLSQTLILVRNKKTKQARVFVSQSCTLVDVQREEEILKRKKALKQIPVDELDYRTRHHNLQLSFGSKKAKRASGVALRTTLDLTTNKELIEAAVADIDVTLKDIKSDDTDLDLLSLLPPCNRNATLVEDIYNINDLLTQEEQDSLRKSAEYLQKNPLTEKDEKTYYFLYKYISQLGARPDLDKIILLLYGDSLIRFFKMTAQEMRGKDNLKKICPHSRTVAAKILNLFTEQAKSVRTKSQLCKERIVCHLMVAVLLANHFQINLELISSCLKGLGQKKLLQLARVVGLKAAKKFGTHVHCLSVPLPPLPKVHMPRRK